MTSACGIALSGMGAAQMGLQVSAHNIANLGTATFRRQQVTQSTVASGGVSGSLLQARVPGNAPETDMVGLLQAKNWFLANLAVFRTSDRMTGSLLDMTS